MKLHPKTKTQLIIGGISLVVLIGGAIGISKYIKSKKHKTSDSKKKKFEDEKLEGILVNYGNEGYVNIRRSPKIDNTGWFDSTHNIIKKAKKNPVGTVLERVNGEDGFSWYKIKITGSDKTGFVREDAVNVEE
jgi:hypothetical protein